VFSATANPFLAAAQLEMTTDGTISHGEELTDDFTITFSAEGLRFRQYQNTVHETDYGLFSFALHHTSYESEVGRVLATHDSTWRTEGLGIHALSWSSGLRVSVSNAHEQTYQSPGFNVVSAIHDVLWASSGTSSVFSAHDTTYDSFIRVPGYTVHEVTWASSGATTLALSIHETQWASLGGASSVFSIHEATYDSFIRVPGFGTHEVTWASSGTTSILASVSLRTRSSTAKLSARQGWGRVIAQRSPVLVKARVLSSTVRSLAS
jgi:hypothetical protein